MWWTKRVIQDVWMGQCPRRVLRVFRLRLLDDLVIRSVLRCINNIQGWHECLIE